MTINVFISRLVKIKNDSQSIENLVNCAINGFEEVDDFTSIEQQIEGIGKDDFTNFGDKLSKCIRKCNELKMGSEQFCDDPYYVKLSKFIETIDKIRVVVDKVGNDRKVKQNTSDAISQNSVVLEEQNKKIQSLKQDIKAANSVIDDKIFSLLINTVAILGIFVAIAFAGFGVMSVFSNIDISLALKSTEAFIKNTFFLVLVAFLSYNLLLLLVFFIFKLSRPLLRKTQSDEAVKDEISSEQEKKFSEQVNLIPFFVVDGVILLAAIVLFFWCLNC